MKIYLAGGMTVINVKGRERELSIKFDKWNRLFSFYFKDLIFKSEIFCIIKENKKLLETKKI
jgi:hypothetical protein